VRILLVGNGGREHALLWKLKQDFRQGEFFATLPNAGMAEDCSSVPISATDVDGLTDWARVHAADLVVVGPEAPLASGLADRLREAGIPCFGPSPRAARIESSKAFAKDLMQRAGVPTAQFTTFTSLDAACSYIRVKGAPIVVKASGLAGGKGAVVCRTVEDALAAAHAMLAEGALGKAGAEVVIEDFMDGEELSILALTDGINCLVLPPSQDHKRVGVGDLGPNTGGMGAYSPVTVATAEVVREAREKVFAPVLRALAEEGARFRGLLYAGLMLTRSGLRVVEFNCRFGDPEAQAVLPLMAGSLLEPMMTIADRGEIEEGIAQVHDGACVTTVVASRGYPGPAESGKPISMPRSNDRELFFHAGTAMSNGRLVSSGGRVLAATVAAPTFREAREASRRAAARVVFTGSFFRSDIGWREEVRLSS